MGLEIKGFYTVCVSYSRACKIEGGSKEWPAIQKWRYSKDGYDYLAQKIADLQALVYVDADATNNHEDFSGYSFKKENQEIMSYKS